MCYSYDMELHMVHTSAGGKTAVIGVLYKLGKPNEFLTRVRIISMFIIYMKDCVFMTFLKFLF